MADVQEYAARLSQSIGPRPAGTEEEQQASFVIEEVLQQEATLDVSSEEFNCNPNYALPRVICCIITLLLALLSLILPVMVVPSLVVCIVTALVYVLETLGISPLSRTSKRGVSQNVIGKYIPAQGGDQGPVARRRKVIVVARYDTGRVRRELSGPLFGALNIIHWIELGGMVLVPLVLLVRALTDAADTFLIVLMVITIIGMVAVALRIISFIMYQTAPYNEGANCNAAGVAVMLEVAKRVGLGLYDQDVEEDVLMHGEAAAREADVLPDGAVVEYDVDAVVDEVAAQAAPAPAPAAAAAVPAVPAATAAAVPGAPAVPDSTSAMAPMDLSDEIAAAQAARAQAPVAMDETISVAQSAPHEEIAAAEVSAQAAAAPAPAPQPVAAPAPVAAAAPKQDNVPDWFKRAQAKAKRDNADSTPAQRSRFAEAIDGATAAREAEAARAAEQRTSAMDERLAEMRANIMNSPDAATAHSAAKAAASAAPQAQQNGVDGFLASTTEAPDYQTASRELPDDAPATNETKQAGDVADRIMSHEAAPAAPAASAAQPAQEAAAEKQPAAAAAPAAKPAAPAKEPKEPRRKRTIDLPSLTGAIQAVGKKKAEGDEKKDAAVPAAAASAPAPAPAPAQPAKAAQPAGNANPRSSFASAIPALDKKVQAAGEAVEEEAAEVVSVAGSFNVGGATGTFAPVGDELVADVDPDDVYIDDADDSDYDEGFTETGAMTSPSFVEMPTKRGMFGRLKRKKKTEETSFAEAIGVDADFDARKVGRDRGGWESFQNGSASYDGGWDEEDDWNGGAFSRERLGAMVSKIKPGRSDDDGQRGRRRGDDGEAASPRTRFSGTDMDDETDAHESHRNLHPFADIPLKGIAEEREAIREFKGGPINMEIWFVALGAELANNAGMKALIADHSAELRGSMVIDLDGLGAGDLSIIQKEGMYRPVSMSSRMKRYVRKAADALGLSVGKADMLWCDTAAYCATRQGYQTLHLAGMQGGKPAYCAQMDDVYDNLDPATLEDNADFLMELIRAI